MKKNRTMRVAVLMLALTLLTCCFVGSTFAKYISEAEGSSTATVAKWSIEVNDGELETFLDGDSSGKPDLTFDLFTTINDTLDSADETDVADGKIAPGTEGSFALKVENLSEVTAKYTITLTENNTSGVYIQYSLDGSTWKDEITGLGTNGVISANLAYTGEEEDKADTITVYWRWVFEGTGVADGATATDDAHAGQTDATDTALGVAAKTTAPTVTVTANIVVEQVD